MKKNVRMHLIISGRVQGVCYRMETRYAAERFGVKGWVKNKADGSVEAVFEGDEESVTHLIEWCRQGPSTARVLDIQIQQEDYLDEFKTFEITY
jgi:acylphosphatase